MGESILQLRQIRKSFDNTEVLKGIDLEVAQGEFITLLGASGCGKTTTLRIIAGLELPDVPVFAEMKKSHGAQCRARRFAGGPPSPMMRDTCE